MLPGAAEIAAARARLAPLVRRTALLAREPAGDGRELFLKLECLQAVGSFKVRPVGSALLGRDPHSLAHGVYTCSSGNSALALAALARARHIPACAVVTPNAPPAKLERLVRLGARIRTVTPEQWWQAVERCQLPQQDGTYIDAVRDPAALAGNATLGLEILEEQPDLDAIFVPFGGGALACGIACAVRMLGRAVAVIACELDSACPYAASRHAGAPVRTAAATGFVSGVGFHSLLPQMWPPCRELIDGSLTVSLAEVAAAIRVLALEHHVVAEGAGAIPVAAALAGRHGFRRVCAVVSGGNLDAAVLAAILQGALP